MLELLPESLRAKTSVSQTEVVPPQLAATSEAAALVPAAPTAQLEAKKPKVDRNNN